MVASFETVELIFRVMRKHCTAEQIAKIIDELQQVPGNKSFRDAVTRLATLERDNRDAIGAGDDGQE